MSHGCMKIMLKDSVIERKYYHSRRDRTKLFEEFYEFLKNSPRPLYIQIAPYPTEVMGIYGKPQVNEQKIKHMPLRIEKWQEEIIQQDLFTLPASEIAKKAGVCQLTVRHRRSQVQFKKKLILSDPPKEPEIKVRPKATYSNRRLYDNI